MHFRSELATSEQQDADTLVYNDLIKRIKKTANHLLLCSLCDTCWLKTMMVTCRVESKYWVLPSSGPARCAQDARRVLHDEPSGPEVLGYRAQGRHCNPFVRCGAPHRNSGAQKGGSYAELEQLAYLADSFRGQRQAEQCIRMHMRQGTGVS